MFTRLFALTGLFATLFALPVFAEEPKPAPKEEPYVFEKPEAVYAIGYVCRTSIIANYLEDDIKKSCGFLKHEKAFIMGMVDRDDGVKMYHLLTRPELTLHWEFGGIKLAFSVAFPTDFYAREDMIHFSKDRLGDVIVAKGT